MMKKFNVLLLLLLVVSFAQAQDASDTFKYESKFETGNTLYFSNLIGELEITGWDKPYISIIAEKNVDQKYIGKLGKKIYSMIKINIIKKGRKIICETRFPKDKQRIKAGLKKGKLGMSVDFQIMVPKETSIHVRRLVSGDITLENLSGRMQVSLIQGTVEATNISGRIDISVSVGSLEMSGINGELTISGSQCDVTLEDITGDLEISTATGEIDVHAIDLDSAVLTTTSSDIELEVDSPLTFGNYRLTALSGDITMTIDSSSAFDIYAKTTSGDISNDFNLKMVKEHGRKYIMGEINGGGAEIVISAFRGDVEIAN